MSERHLMKAAVGRRYGPPDVIEIVDVPRPKVGAEDVLVRVRATTVNAGDWRLRSGTVPPGFGLFIRLAVGFSGPRNPILGGEIAGDVVAVLRWGTRLRAGGTELSARAAGCHSPYGALPADHNATARPQPRPTPAAALTLRGLT